MVENFSGLEMGFTSMLEITKNCSLRCKHCYIQNKDSQPELSKEEWFKIMDKLVKLGSKNCVLLGGEPSMYKGGFVEVLWYAVKKFENVVVQTNGCSSFDYTPYPVIVSVSFESVIPEYDNQIRGFVKLEKKDENGNTTVEERGHYEVALDFLRRTTNPKIVRYTLLNNSDVEASIIMAEKYGAGSVFVPLKELGFGKALNHLVPSRKKLQEDFVKVENLSEKFERRHFLQCPEYFLWNNKLREKYAGLFLKRRSCCEAGRKRLFIDSEGEVYLCEFVPKKFGNILKENGNVIKSRINKFLKEQSNKKATGNCLGCPLFSACGSGCMATNNNWNKSSVTNKECPILK